MLRKFVPYMVAAWLAVAFLGYGMALRSFALTPGLFTQGNRHFEAPIAAIRSSGFGRFTHYRIRLQNADEEFDIPPALAYPLTSRNPRANRKLGDLLSEGLRVGGVTTGGDHPIVLGLAIYPVGGMQEEMLNYDESIGRYLAAQPQAATEGLLFEILGLLLFPGLFGARWGWARVRVLLKR